MSITRASAPIAARAYARQRTEDATAPPGPLPKACLPAVCRATRMRGGRRQSTARWVAASNSWARWNRSARPSTSPSADDPSGERGVIGVLHATLRRSHASRGEDLSNQRRKHRSSDRPIRHIKGRQMSGMRGSQRYLLLRTRTISGTALPTARRASSKALGNCPRGARICDGLQAQTIRGLAGS